MKPIVSVIVPVYNVETYLSQCIDSVRGQTLKNIEILCVDDGSTDRSFSLLENLSQQDGRIHIFRQTNAGAGKARNLGLAKAQGKFIYFLDADDFIVPDCLERFVRAIQTADICVGNAYYIDSKGQKTKNFGVIGSAKAQQIIRVREREKDLYQLFAIGVWTKLYRREFLTKNRIEFQEIRTCNDLSFYYVSLGLAEEIRVLGDEPIIYSRRERNGSISSDRGRYMGNLLAALSSAREQLQNRKVFEAVRSSFYKQCIRNIKYEVACCTDYYARFCFLLRAARFLPILQATGLLLEESLKWFFSIENTVVGSQKKVCIFGLRFSIKREKI